MFSLRNSPDPMLGTILNQGKKWNNWMSNYKNLGVSKVKLDLIGKPRDLISVLSWNL